MSIILCIFVLKLLNMRIKSVYKRNLNMSVGKVASQIAHAVKNLGITPTDCDIIVLKVSDKKFDELVQEHPNGYVQVDKGLTIVESGTATAMAWIESE
jgi:peptidyl-tRNA hydrolase